MLRSRIIRPGIATNEALATLGPYATLLFERLWMLADREGRLEDRPARIRVEAFPYWPELDVENLLEKLATEGFILRYLAHDKRALVQICEFQKHQHVHPHESRSVLPAPVRKNTNGVRRRKRETSPQDNDVSNVITCNGAAVTCDANGAPCQVLSTYTYKSKSGGARTTTRARGATVENSPPPQPQNTNAAPSAEIERKAPGRERTHRDEKQARSVSHPAADVELVRESLAGLGTQIGLPPPDDELVHRVLDAGRGATAEQIHATLVALYKRNKFGAMRSWGFIPIVIGDCFRAA